MLYTITLAEFEPCYACVQNYVPHLQAATREQFLLCVKKYVLEGT